MHTTNYVHSVYLSPFLHDNRSKIKLRPSSTIVLLWWVAIENKTAGLTCSNVPNVVFKQFLIILRTQSDSMLSDFDLDRTRLLCTLNKV